MELELAHFSHGNGAGKSMPILWNLTNLDVMIVI